MTRTSPTTADHEAAPRIAPVPTEQRRAALERLGRSGVAISDEQARRLTEAAEGLGVDFDQLWGAFDAAGGLEAVALLVYRPGRTAMVFNSQPRTSDDVPTLAALLDRVTAAADPGRASLVQALVSPDDRLELQGLAEGGYEHLAELQYMQRSIPRRPPKPRDLPPGVGLEAYEASRHEAFIQALERSYIETRDCPKLRGMRRTADVLEGHMNGGRFEPGLWTLVREGGEPRGLMLLNLGEQLVLELTYLGLGPELRGRGIGAGLLERAMRQARDRGVRTMSLAVDTNNGAAMGLYHRLGFYRIARRVAMVRRVSV